MKGRFYGLGLERRDLRDRVGLGDMVWIRVRFYGLHGLGLFPSASG